MTEWISSYERSRYGIEDSKEKAWSKEEFEKRLRQKVIAYHTQHPFHQAMIEGTLNRRQIQGWVANRFYYQASIPKKDAAILANCPNSDFRRKWIQRIIDQDGSEMSAGGLEGWISLGMATGLSREDIVSFKMLRPGVRFACDAYLNFAKTAPWQEAVCSSLTELFAHNAHRERIESFPHNYPWIDPDGLSYFKERLKQLETDVQHGLSITLSYFNNLKLQERALEILGFKLDVLWSILDSIQQAYGLGDKN